MNEKVLVFKTRRQESFLLAEAALKNAGVPFFASGVDIAGQTISPLLTPGSIPGNIGEGGWIISVPNAVRADAAAVLSRLPFPALAEPEEEPVSPEELRFRRLLLGGVAAAIVAAVFYFLLQAGQTAR